MSAAPIPNANGQLPAGRKPKRGIIDGDDIDLTPPLDGFTVLVPEADDVKALAEQGFAAELYRPHASWRADGLNVVVLQLPGNLYWTSQSIKTGSWCYRQGALSVRYVLAPTAGNGSVCNLFHTGVWTAEGFRAEVERTPIADCVPHGWAENPNGQNVECVECVEVPREREWAPLRLKSLPPPAEFPIDVLPDACVELARAIARAVGCDVASIGGSMLAIAGGMIGRTVHLKLRDIWIVQPSIYHANIGEPGQGKTWALKYLIEGAIAEIEEALRADFAAEKAIYLERCKTDKKAVQVRPIPGQLLIDDSTIEALYIALSHNPRGLLSVLDELSVLFAGLNQYKGGKGADRSHFLKTWTGARVTINRTKNEFGEPLYIPFPHLSITGNIPPDNLHLIRGPHGNDGMIERWLYTFPDWHKKLKASERGSVAQSSIDDWNDIIRRLWGRRLITNNGEEHPALLVFSEPGAREFFGLYDRHVDEFNSESFPPHLRGAWSKLEIYAGRFACVLKCLEMASIKDDRLTEVSAPIAEGTWRLVDYFKSEHKRVLACLDRQGGTMPEGVRLHLAWIKNHPHATEFSERDISITYPPNKGYDAAMMLDARVWLMEKNAIMRKPSTVRDPSTPGRKPSPVWIIHPDLRSSTHSTHSTNSAIDTERN
jgi:hypothetical protein